jgi:hypothetical protein
MQCCLSSFFFNLSPVWVLAVRLNRRPSLNLHFVFYGRGYCIRPIDCLVEDGVNPLNLPAIELYAMAM